MPRLSAFSFGLTEEIPLEIEKEDSLSLAHIRECTCIYTPKHIRALSLFLSLRLPSILFDLSVSIFSFVLLHCGASGRVLY